MSGSCQEEANDTLLKELRFWIATGLNFENPGSNMHTGGKRIGPPVGRFSLSAILRMESKLADGEEGYDAEEPAHGDWFDLAFVANALFEYARDPTLLELKEQVTSSSCSAGVVKVRLLLGFPTCSF